MKRLSIFLAFMVSLIVGQTHALQFYEGRPHFITSTAGALDVAIVRVAANTTTGTQDITSSGFGTPDAAIILSSSAIADNTLTVEQIISVGVTDCTNQWVVAGQAENGVTTMNTDRRGASDEMVMWLDTSSGIIGEANFDSCITDGVRINFADNAPESAYLMVVILFTGLTNAYAGTLNVVQPSGTDTSTTDPGFTPDSLFIASSGSGFGDTTSTNYAAFFGFADNQGTIADRAVSHFNGNGGSAVTMSASHFTTRNNINQSASAVSRGVSTKTFDANGFTMTHQGPDNFDHTIGYLALEFGTSSHWVGSVTSPTTSSDWSITAPGFTPQFVMLITTDAVSDNGILTDDLADCVSFGVFAGTGQEFSLAYYDNDAATTTESQTLQDNVAVHSLDAAAADQHLMTFSTFDANGWTLSVTTFDGTGRRYAAWAIE